MLLRKGVKCIAMPTNRVIVSLFIQVIQLADGCLKLNPFLNDEF